MVWVVTCLLVDLIGARYKPFFFNNMKYCYCNVLLNQYPVVCSQCGRAFFFFSFAFSILHLAYCSLAGLIACGKVLKLHGYFVVQFVCSPCIRNVDRILEDHPLPK